YVAPSLLSSFPTRRSSDLVEEVRRLGAEELDDVHRRHRETGAVDQAADFTVEGDVGEVILRGFDFAFVFLANVTKIGPFLVAERDRKSTRLNSSHVKISYA